MCGICGAWSWRADVPGDAVARAVDRMAETIAHRGPDDHQVWVDPEAGLGLGFRRLAILDLSPLGRQPMVSACGRWVIVFNGEIYNFQELRAELAGKGHGFKGHSDTEVLLAAIAEWGLEETLKRANGMLALALWDRRDRKLWLARDRLGKKPLYYGQAGDTILFGSELKALAAHPAFRREVDRDALGRYLQYSWVPGSSTIWRGIKKLPAGCLLRIDRRGIGEATPYWSVGEAAERGARAPFSGSFEESVESLDRLLADAVRRRTIADVPLGAFLSGGIDSSTIVALMQSQASRPVKTFAIGFEEAAYNEAPYAAEVARHLGTDHTEFYVSANDGLEIVPRLADIWDEPFADPSQIPTFIVAQLAKRDVSVCLSGDGGDELFGGYSSYPSAMRKWRKLGGADLEARRTRARRLRAIGSLGWRLAAAGEATSLSSTKLFRWLAKQEERARDLQAADPLDLFARRREHWPEPTLALGAHPLVTPLSDAGSRLQLPTPEQSMMYLDMVTYLVDDILVKVDRASMAVALEMRAPLLDWRVAEFALSLPLPYRLGDDGVGKRVLRGVLDRYVPRTLIDRPKSGLASQSLNGFEAPCGRGPRTFSNPPDSSRKATLTPTRFSGFGGSICPAGVALSFYFGQF